MQIEGSTLVLDMASQDVDHVVCGHDIAVHILHAMAAIVAADALGLSHKLLALGTFLACIILIHADDNVA